MTAVHAAGGVGVVPNGLSQKFKATLYGLFRRHRLFRKVCDRCLRSIVASESLEWFKSNTYGCCLLATVATQSHEKA